MESLRMRIASLLILVPGLLLCGAGCSRSDSGHISETVPETVPAMTEPLSADPLSVNEISLFLSVVRQLPGQRPPEFVESEMVPLQFEQQLGLAVMQMRESIRRAITAQRQVAAWNHQLELKQAFQGLSVDPLEFANLMLRISCAWSAWQVSQERSLPEAREMVDNRITQLMQEFRLHDGQEHLQDRKQLLELLEELVTLSEFVRLLEQVPPASLRVVASAESELRQILPETTLREKFAHYVDSQARILRASYQK